MATQQRRRRRQRDAAALAGLVVLMRQELDKAFALLKQADLATSVPHVARVVHAIIVKYARMAVSLAARQYEQAAAGLQGRPPLQIPTPPTLQQVEAMVEHATEAPTAADAVVAEAERIVVEASHTTTLETVFADRRAKGYARVPEPSPCAFCALLATRGPVYKDDSFDAANKRFTGPGKARVHDDCRCDLEPIFTAWEPSAQVREWQKLYGDLPPTSGTKATLKAWRKAFREHQKQSAAEPVNA